jgi:uncharacterized membrane protein
MEKYEERRLLERIERLEGVVEELRRSLARMNTSMAGQAQTSERIEHERHRSYGVREPAVEPGPKPSILSESPKTTAARTPLSSPDAIIRPSRTREEWESLIGGKLLNRIGALALIIGIGFFLKYAFDNNWINETTRVLIGAFIGIALLFGGARFHKKGLAIFAQGLVGAGIPILYLSVYASFNFYHLVSQPVAFVLMSAVTITAFQQGLRYDSFAVSLLGWFGGFITPFLLNTGEANEIGLFTYIALLDAGLIAVLFRKHSWAVIELLSLLATYLVYGIWYEANYTVSAFPATIVFLTLFWGLFHALDITRIIKPVTSFPRLRQMVSALNAAFYFLGMNELFEMFYHEWNSTVILLIGVAYFGTFLWSQKRRDTDENTGNRLVLTAGAMLVLATGIQYSGFVRVAGWSFEALALFWYGSSKKLHLVWKAAVGLFAISTFHLYFTQFPKMEIYEPVAGMRFLFNERALAFASLALSLGLGCIPVRQLREQDGIAILKQVFHYWWSNVLFVLFSVETYDLFFGRTLYMITLMLVLCWAVYSLVMSLPALKLNVEPVLNCGLAALFLAFMFAVATGLSTFEPIGQYRLVLNVRAGVIAFLIMTAYFHTRMHTVLWPGHKWHKQLITVFQIVPVILLFTLLTGETKDFFDKSIYLAKRAGSVNGQSVIGHLGNLKQLSLSGIWLIYSILLMGAGMWRRLQGLRILAIVLFGFTILKIFIYDLSFLESLYRIVSFIGLGVILLGVSYLYQRYKAVIFESPAAEKVHNADGAH